MKQSDIKVAVSLQQKIDKLQQNIDTLNDESKKQLGVKIDLPSGYNNYNDRTSYLSSGIVDTIQKLVVADLESQIQFMKKKITNL